MRIFVINWQDIRNPQGGGAEVHCHEIFKRIAAAGHDVTLLCCGFDGAPATERLDGITIVRVGSRNDFNFHVYGYYRKHVRDRGFDIVIDDINKIPFYTPLYVREPLLAISHHFFGRSIYRETNVVGATYVYLAEKLVNWVYKKTPFAVVSQSTLDEFIERGFNRQNFHVIRNAIDHASFPMKVQSKENQPVITYFSRVKKYKSPDHLLRAFARIKPSIPNGILWFIGTGDFVPELKELSIELGVQDSVIFHGRVSEAQKRDLLGRSWCVVNTSMKEGWGITNIEANACGTLTVAANVPGLRDSVAANQSGLLYEYGDIDALSAILTRVCSDSAIRQRLSEGAVEWARSFSWEAEAQAMMKLCEEIIIEKAPKHR